MTAKPPSSSTLSPDTPIETMATVTFTEIRDSKGDLVGKNTTTFDKNLTATGMAGPNTDLWLRDGLTRLVEVTSGASGNWIKQLPPLSTFKRYSLNAIEKELPQDSSTQYIFVLATETPIIDKVTGKDGPIESGATYDGDSLEFSGHAPPEMEVEAFNGDTPTGKQDTVDRNGQFNLTFDGLTAGAYSIKIRAANGKESDVFEFRVVLDVKLILDRVYDSQEKAIPEGGTTYDNKVTVHGYAKPGEDVQLRNNETLIDGATATAELEKGSWKIEHEVFPGPHSLDAQACYGEGEISKPPYPFIVALDVKLSLDDVADSEGSIDEGGKTYDNKVTVSGYARPGKDVQLRNYNVDIPEAIAHADEEDGYWTFELDVSPRSYSLTVQARYGDDEISEPPRTFTVELAVELSLDDVLESEDGPPVPDDGTTDKNQLIIKGHARPGESIQLLNDGNPIKDAIAPADPDDGQWKFLLDVIDGFYRLAAKANYGEGDITDPPRTFTVSSIIKPHNTRVYDSDGPIEDNGSTPYNHVIVRGDAKPSAGIKLKINGVTDPTPEPTDDKGKWVRFVPNLKYDTRHTLIAVADYGNNAESNPWTFTTGKQDVKPDIESVKDSNGTLVLSGSETRDIHLTVSGKAAPGQKVRLLKGIDPLGEPEADGEGKWVQPITAFTEFVSLTVKALYGQGETSFPPYTFTVTPFGEVTNIVDSKNNPILEGGYTTDTSLTFIGKASPHHTVEIWNHNSKWKEVTADGDDDWRHVRGVSLGLHSITIKVKDVVSSPPRTFYVVENSELIIDRVTSRNGTPIQNSGSVPHSPMSLIYFYGSGAYQYSEIKLYVNDNLASIRYAEENGEFQIDTGELLKGSHRFQVKGVNGQVSQDWYITIT